MVRRQVGRCNYLPNCKAGVDFIELVADKAQVFFHSRNIGIGEVRTIKLVEGLADSHKLTHENEQSRDAYIIDKVTQTTERQDEEINLAQQRALPRLIIRVQVIADLLRHHLELPRRINNPPKPQPQSEETKS